MPGEGILDFMFDQTPSSAVEAYVPIVQEMRPTQKVLEAVDRIEQRFSGPMTGIHFRGKVDDRQVRHEVNSAQFETIMNNRPCFVATECPKLRASLRDCEGVIMSDLDETKLIQGDYVQCLGRHPAPGKMQGTICQSGSAIHVCRTCLVVRWSQAESY
jgi:hypothetical protein